ncbi:Transcriptional regulator, MarR family [hydrothermal vent metagenome]|uniref:Transcriptional regulator, MarR family n=1 Tax=hydrothermal vent metagenome TaxID=652676 RepID=A0A3B0R0C5_9ZZZZ
MENNKKTSTNPAESDDYRSLLLMDEIARNEQLTQRDLSRNLGVALGLINSYIKNLASKGFITVSQIPRNRYKYYLTPKGFKEKSRLTYEHLRNFTNLYRVARGDFSLLFSNIKESGIKRIAFCGIDEVTEIAYLSLKEAGLVLAGVADESASVAEFFGTKVVTLRELVVIAPELFVITSFNNGDELRRALLELGVDKEKIRDISEGNWIKKIEK